MAAEAAPAPAPAPQCHEAGGGEAGTAQIDTSPLVVTAPGRAPLQGHLCVHRTTAGRIGD